MQIVLPSLKPEHLDMPLILPIVLEFPTDKLLRQILLLNIGMGGRSEQQEYHGSSYGEDGEILGNSHGSI